MEGQNFARHENYKGSGVEWFDEIPAEWNVKRLKYVVKIVKNIAGREGPDVLSITQKGIRIKDIESGEGQLAMDYSKYQIVNVGDFAMNHMDLLTGYVGISAFAGVTSPDYRVFKNISPGLRDRYILLIFQMGYHSKIFFRYGQGVSFLGRWRFPAENFNNFFIPIPSIQEQDAIIRFVDEKTAKIDEAIAIEERQIALLKERKQIVIQNAVTKGLSPNAPMKDSGVDWIGEIPAHWSLYPLFGKTRMKSVSNCPDRELLSVYLDRGVVKFSEIDEKRTNATSLDLKAYQAVDPGDFVLNNQQAWRGSVGVSTHAGIVSPAYIVLSLSAEFDAEFANFYFRSPAMVAHYLIGSKGVGTIQRNLYWPKLRTIQISIPPLAEQVEILSYIRSEVGKINQAIDLKNEQILALREYKATLINSAVTGKIKVA